MTFINRYTQADSLNYYYSKEFLEENRSFIYAIGKTQQHGLITKIDVDGNIVWQKRYDAENKEEPLAFHQIIQLGEPLGSPPQGGGGMASPPPALQYIVYATKGTAHYLLAIDAVKGDVIWMKEIGWKNTDIQLYLENSKTDYSFYMVISDKNQMETGMRPFVARYNYLCNQLAGNLMYVPSEDFMLNAIHTHEEGVALAGRFMKENTTGAIMHLDSDLQLVDANYIERPFTDLHDIKLLPEKKYLVSGYNNGNDSVFISLITGEGSMITYTFPESGGNKSKIQLGEGEFYVLLTTGSHGVLYCFKWDFSMQWRKEIRLNGGENGIEDVQYNLYTASFAANGFNPATESVVIHTASDFSSCLTEVLENQELKRDKCSVRRMETGLEDFKIPFKDHGLKMVDIGSDRVELCGGDVKGEEVPLTETASIQSPHIYLQSAGSKGQDSTKGMHLRWALKGALANHLPKGDYATQYVNFNRPSDYVKIYRTPYVATPVIVDFGKVPGLVNDAGRTWVYSIDNYVFHIYFRNAARYDQVRSSINPGSDPLGFVKAYGNALIEVENKTELSFAVTLKFLNNNTNTTRLELLSVEENKISAPKAASLRKTFSATDLNNRKLFSENIRSVRFNSANDTVTQIHFEFYTLFLALANKRQSWTSLGKYALTKETPVAYSRLEPTSNSVHGKWLRYNDNAYVDVKNYQTRWDGTPVDEDKIASVVDRYISLSDDAANPTAIENIPYYDPGQAPIPGYEPDPDFEPGDRSFEISNLYLLNIAALDYHVARMLGLGTLDMNSTVFSGQFIYLAEYMTEGRLGDEPEPQKVQHIYMSLPTSINDERLPIPVDLKAPVPGIFVANGTEAPTILTDANGYSQDGKTRFLTLYNELLPDELANAAFFYKTFEFMSSANTIPVYAGLEYRKTGSALWNKPELSYSRTYFNVDNSVSDQEQKRETVAIVIPEQNNPLFLHREKQNGFHDYSSYGINWFSRAARSTVTWSIETNIKPTNSLLPPTNINAYLIQKESPLMFSSAQEQQQLNNITGSDKTLIRLTYDYNHAQELISYHSHVNEELVSSFQVLPDNEELFAEDVEVFFRNEVPNAISGKVISVTDAPGNPLLSVITTGQYVVLSAGVNPTTNQPNEVLVPQIPAGTEANYIGSLMVIDNKEYVIHQIDNSQTYPKFTVFKSTLNGEPITLNATVPVNELVAPVAGGLFMIVENMLSTGSWSTPAPLSFKVKAEPVNVYSEQVFIRNTDGSNDTYLQKFRGVYGNATVEAFLEKVDENNDGEYDKDGAGNFILKHKGIYKITFPGVHLNQHSQFSTTGHSVSFYNGVVRLYTDDSMLMPARPNGKRKDLTVIRTENIGTSSNLIVYAVDNGYPANGFDPNYDYIHMGTNLSVNYYPGYKVYLYKDAPNGLVQGNILPDEGTDVRYSVFGLRSHDAGLNYVSRISAPVLMFAQSIKEPKQPEQPLGGDYATRPDFFGKSSYTFTTKYQQKPYSVQFNRASDIQILSAIYDNTIVYNANGTPINLPTTVQEIMVDIFGEGEDVYYINRWNDFLDFDTNRAEYKRYPDTAAGVRLPMPDNPRFIAAINAFITQHNAYFPTEPPVGQLMTITALNQQIIPQTALHDKLLLIDFIRDAIYNCFVPLTEIPVIYQHIKGGSYAPIPKKQVVRDRNGNLLPPTDPDFDMAPMMKVTNTSPNETQFTDFGLDGASNARYFYTVREINLQMKVSPYSKIKGPITLVNTAPPYAPEIIKVIPVMENRTLGIAPAMQLQINPYPASQNVRKINIYRSFKHVDALTVRTMDLVKTIDLEAEGMMADQKWIFTDDFSDLAEVPYGDVLYYRITVARKIKYNDKDNNLMVEYAPSEASKVIVTNIVENYLPQSPEVKYYSEPIDAAGQLASVVLNWEKTVYTGGYTVYKMSDQGNWVEISKLEVDLADKSLLHVSRVDASGNWTELVTVQMVNNQVYLPLEFTNVNTSTLQTKDAATNKTIFHHFKVLAQNFAGMQSKEEHILSLYNAANWQDLGGISDGTAGNGLVIEGSFIIR